MSKTADSLHFVFCPGYRSNQGRETAAGAVDRDGFDLDEPGWPADGRFQQDHRNACRQTLFHLFPDSHISAIACLRIYPVWRITLVIQKIIDMMQFVRDKCLK